MAETRKQAGIETLLKTLLACAVVPWGCGDLSLEADRTPTEVVIVPGAGLFTVGEPTKLELLVNDQNGEAMPVPGWATPVWKASDRHVAEIGQDGTLTGMHSGMTDVSARVGSLTTSATFRMNPDQLLLTAPVIYLSQAAQNRHGSVRLLAGRTALLRVFMAGDQTSFFEPGARVTLLQGSDVVFERILPPQADSIPTIVDESRLGGSFNVEVPGSVIQPGVRMVVELDPEGVVPLAPGSRTRYPETGSSELHVVETQLFRQVFVPTLFNSAADPTLFTWLDGIGPDSEQMRHTRKLLPVSDMEVEVRETFHTSLVSMSHWINQIRVLHIQEGRRGYYYGVSGRIGGGIANFGVPWSVGAANARIHTHEVGHNMDLFHAACGGAVGQDPKYPYPGGSIGIWGYDAEGKTLHDPAAYKDIMGYCPTFIWISDFQFDHATTHRLNGDGGVDLNGESGPGRGEMLVVWGRVTADGRLKLDPAFLMEGPEELPGADGPYRVEGLGAGGGNVFSLSFAPTPLEGGGGTFVFFVPYEPEWASTLDRMVLTGPEGEYTVTRDGEPAMAVVTDPSTGLIQAIIPDWDGGPLPGEETADVTVTRGIPAGGLR